VPSLDAAKITTGTFAPTRIATDANNRFVTDAEKTSWNDAVDWGNHASAGYMAGATYDANTNNKVDGAENADALGGQAPGYYTNPANIATSASYRFVIDTDIASWDGAVTWGDHGSVGYLTSVDWASPGAMGATT